jgi:hypothetical protein
MLGDSTAFLNVLPKVMNPPCHLIPAKRARAALLSCVALAALLFPSLASAQNLFVVSGGSGANTTILEVTPGGNITTFASGFNVPVDLAFNSNGDLFVASEKGNISEVTPTGNVSTFVTGFSGLLGGPMGLAFDRSGNLYFANTQNNIIYKVTPSGNVSTFASGFDAPYGLAFNSIGDLFVANSLNGTIAEVTPAGSVTTFASGFNGPTYLAFDAQDNLYAVNYGSQGSISKITPSGNVTTFADPPPSGFDAPSGLAFASTGILFAGISLSGNISEITPGGNISTFVSGFNGIGALAFSPFPAVTTQPANQIVTSGQNAELTVAAASFSSLSYQWQRLPSGSASWSNLTNNQTYANATTASLTVNSTLVVMSGDQFRCLVINSVGSVLSNAALLTVNPLAPMVVIQPVSQVVVYGQTAQFTTAASGDPAPAYQWQLLPAGTKTWISLNNSGNYSGVNSPTLIVGNSTSSLTGDQFRCVTTNTAGTNVSNAATLTVKTSVPIITTQPKSVSVERGQSLSFTVKAIGTIPFTYRWERNGIKLTDTSVIKGSKSALLTITRVSLANAGTYLVIVSNSLGQTASIAVTLKVK